MTPFKKRNSLITIVNNEDIGFVLPEHLDEGGIPGSFPLDQFLSADMESDPVPEELSNRVNSLLIVPDYWFGNATFKFQSRKKSIIEAFIERKLQSENPDLPDIKYFFGYIPYQTEQRERELYVYFLQDPKAFQLYNQLVKFNLDPRRITIPAFVWGQKLSEIIPNFQIGGKGLVHILSNECFLYFFFRDFFLFSRSIAFPDPQMESSEKIDTLTYEINQSLYLFSQKAKAGIDQIFLTSSVQSDAQKLSDALGREVKKLKGLGEGRSKNPVIAKDIGSVRHFRASDLSLSSKFLSILHQMLRKELEWKPVQATGIAVGLILLLLFGAESFFLWKWSESNQVSMTKAETMTAADAKYTIQQYDEALDFLIKEAERPSPQETIVKVARSLPDNFLVKEMMIEVEGKPGVYITGSIKAAGPDKFKDSISCLLENLKKNFQGALSLGIQDINFEIDKNSDTQQGYQKYLVTFGFALL